MEKPSIDTVYKHLKDSNRFLCKFFKEIKKDFEYALGKQWKDADVLTLEHAGVKALTINKIKPLIKLITGIERQSRSDFQAYPEGLEDELLSEIATRLLKNIAKTSNLKHKLSDVFKEGVIGGLCYIEPYLDYSTDLINGTLKFRKVIASRVLFDPAAEEYDLSDGKYLIKLTTDLTHDDVLALFPDGEEKLKMVSKGKLFLDSLSDDGVQTKGYDSFAKQIDNSGLEKTYDLIEYYYKFPIDVYYVISKSNGLIHRTSDKKEADLAVATSQLVDVSVLTKREYEIRLKQVIGDIEFYDDRAPTFPRWNGYPLFPYFAERMTVDIDDTSMLIQGVVRSLRDLQEEYNKRRTQELRHLNSSVNSGMFVPKDALDDDNKNKLKQFGSTPGVKIYYDPDRIGGIPPNSWRIEPTALSQGHAQLAIENAQDIKEAGGVNPDLLANDSQSQSGRAILLKQRQGLVMVQELLDNYSQTKELIGRFILSQLSDVFTVESAMKVLGDNFLKENFKKPVFDIQGNPLANNNGQLQTEFDVDLAKLTINKVLNDSSIGRYDVTIGEGTYSETIQMANFATLVEMSRQGIPIPPDVLIAESLLSAGQKEKILNAIQAASATAGTAGTAGKDD